MLIAALTLLLLGSALATRGLIGRRVGNESRCRKCKYNLTGVESKECPECGRAWTLETAARGLRFRRRLPLTLGIIVCVLGAALLTPAVQRRSRKAYLYQYLPTKWIIPAARDGDWEAFFVIQNRFSGFSPDERSAFIDAALDRQSFNCPHWGASLWVDLLDQLWRHNQLTDQQQAQFEEQFARLQLAIRPRVKAGDRIPIDIIQEFRAPRSSPYSDEFTIEGLTLDGTRMDVPRYWVTERARPLVNCLEDTVSYFLDPPGDFKTGSHCIAIDVVHRRSRWTDDPRPSSRTVWQRAEKLEGHFETLPPGQDGSITILTDAATGNRIRDAISPTVTIATEPATGKKLLWVDAFATTSKIPVVGLTYAVYVIPPNSTDRLRFGDFRAMENSGSGSNSGGDDIAKRINVGDSVTVVLRFDPEPARMTTGMASTWQGELEFGPIVVTQDTRRATRAYTPDPTQARYRERTAAERYSPTRVSPPPPLPDFAGPLMPPQIRDDANLRSILNSFGPTPTSQPTPNRPNP